MFGGGMARSLKVIDFYKRPPSDYSQGTISGACISIVSITTLIVLSISAISNYMTPIVMTDLIMDARHSEDPLKVSIDISFPNFPCSALSLDTQNVLKVHNLNIREGINKYVLPGMELYDDSRMNDSAISEAIIGHLRNKNGCRVVGVFNVQRVPGDFHFSTHGYSNHIHDFMSSGVSVFDLSHRIASLYFGEQKPTREAEKSLAKFTSVKQIEQNFLGITYTYFLQIIPRSIIYSNGYHKETFFYTARINEVVLPTVPLVLFKYQTNPMTEVEIGEYQPFYVFLIQLVAIIGGIFTVSSIIDQMVHTSVKFLLEKHRLNKLS